MVKMKSVFNSPVNALCVLGSNEYCRETFELCILRREQIKKNNIYELDSFHLKMVALLYLISVFCNEERVNNVYFVYILSGCKFGFLVLSIDTHE